MWIIYVTLTSAISASSLLQGVFVCPAILTTISNNFHIHHPFAMISYKLLFLPLGDSRRQRDLRLRSVLPPLAHLFTHCRVKTESDGTRRSTGGEVKGKEVNGVGSQHSCTVSEDGLSSITTADAHTSAASSRLNWHPRRYKWTRPFRWKTKSGFCACAITSGFHSTCFLPGVSDSDGLLIIHSLLAPQLRVVCSYTYPSPFFLHRPIMGWPYFNQMNIAPV